jgi:hypothetical protein
VRNVKDLKTRKFRTIAEVLVMSPTDMFSKFYVVFFRPLLQTGFKKWRNSTLQYKFGGLFGISQLVRKKACAALWRIYPSNKRAAANIGLDRVVYKPSSEECGDYRIFCIKQQRTLLSF